MTDLTQSLRVEMERFLAQFAGEKVLLIPNEGNAGDCLILASTLTAMAKASIDVEVVDNGADFRNQTVFLGGGGNLIDVYRGMRQSIEACRSKAARIVLLPHTIRGNAGLLKSLDDRVTIWCRDKRSLEHVGSLNPDLDCRLGHDMAFHCDVAEYLNDPACNEYGLPQLRAGLQRVGVNLDRLSRLAVVRFMRTDKESLFSRIASDLDVSRAFGGVADVEASKLAAWSFLKTISVSNRVITDRLHVAIACALLGKNCELLDNAYNKNREVYAHSLHRFPWLSLTKIAGECIADQPPIKRPLLARVAKHTQRIAGNRASRNSATR